jgi:hypothetical protein
MFIDRNAVLSAPFGGAEINVTLATQVHAAPPNGAHRSWLVLYKHLTPSGVKPGLFTSATSVFACGFGFPDRLIQRGANEIRD